MTTPIGIVSTIIIALAILMNGQEIIKTDNLHLSGDKNIDKITDFEIEEDNTILVSEKEDSININLFGMNMYPSWDGKADERDLTGEYVFLKEIAEKNDLEISRQMKIYIKDEEKGEYSKFQENFIIYKEKNNNEYSSIELTFSENEFIEEKVPADGEWIKPSIIENQKLQIFERQSLENEKNVTGKTLFNINGMNFRINIYNVSHEKFIKIIKTTIKGYKNFEISKVISNQIQKEIDIWQKKPCDERYIYILTNNLNSYIYDYENNRYNLVLSDENIEYVNILNVFPKSNKIYLDVGYKDGKSFLIGVDYPNATIISKIECFVGNSDIKISENEQKITYRKDSSSLYVANIDGSNEKLLLESVNNGENPDTTGYIPIEFIDNNKILYTCIGWEDTKGCGIIEIDTGKNVYYENKNIDEVRKVIIEEKI